MTNAGKWRIVGARADAFRRLSKGSGVITAFGDGSWSATDVRARDVPAILAEPSGWDELSGTSWLGEH